MSAALIKPLKPVRPVVKPVERSFQGIRNALFDEWDAMRNGQTSVESVKAASRAAHALMETLSVQMESMRFAQSNAGMADRLLK